jgi:hypothetical protein
MGLFAGLKDAKTWDRGTFLKPGVYTLRVKKAIFKHTRKNIDAYILECKIESAKGPDASAQGTTASWFQSLGDPDIGYSSLKKFAADILGMDPKNPEFVEQVEGFLEATVNDGAINGMLLPCEVTIIKTKKNTDFSLHAWGKIIEETSVNGQQATA